MPSGLVQVSRAPGARRAGRIAPSLFEPGWLPPTNFRSHTGFTLCCSDLLNFDPATYGDQVFPPRNYYRAAMRNAFCESNGKSEWNN